MIIKSMSRKESSYRQLFEYMQRGANRNDDGFHFSHNSFGRKSDDVIREFEEQGHLLPLRKNGIYLYHEIISISRSNLLSEDEQKEILAEIVRDYVQSRAHDHMVSGFMHDEKDNNLHFHLMISSNEVGQSKRRSLRKKEFSDIKKTLEKRVLENYPELEQKQLISKKSRYRDDKEELSDALRSIFSMSASREGFHNNLAGNNVEYKVTGDDLTFINKKSSKRYRLKTLGLLEDYKKMELKFHKGDQSAKNRDEVSIAQNRKTTSISEILKGWVLGGFSEREKRINLEGEKLIKDQWKRLAALDVVIRNRKFLSKKMALKEEIKDVLKEWVFGDFSARKARAINDQYRSDIRMKGRRDLTKMEALTEGVREWVFGDFSARKARVRKDRYRDRTDFDPLVKGARGLTRKEILTETVSEWVFGDFSERDTRARKARYKKQNVRDAHVKNRGDLSKKEVLEEGVKEWAFGDSSARNARIRKRTSIKRMKQWRDNKKRTQTFSVRNKIKRR